MTKPVATKRQISDHEILVEELRWKKFPILDDGFVCLVDIMGDDAAVVQAARVSYGQDARLYRDSPEVKEKLVELYEGRGEIPGMGWSQGQVDAAIACIKRETLASDANLIRYMMRHRHGTPFEMCEMKFLVRVPMDCWRQWIRHRTANVNEYSTRYTPAIDSAQTTPVDGWRLQSQSNKQGSGGLIGENDEFPHDIKHLRSEDCQGLGQYLTGDEQELQLHAREVYETRLKAGVAKEVARKDLPLSTYTEAYWKCDLRNILHFLGLRMDSHAQLEIRQYATAIGEQIVKPLFPVVWQAFLDYQHNAMVMSALDQAAMQSLLATAHSLREVDLNEGILRRATAYDMKDVSDIYNPPFSVRFFLDNHGQVNWRGKRCRERDECLAKLQKLGIVADG